MTLLGRAAVAGFGAAAGRDAYRVAKKQSALFIVVAVAAGAVVLPFIGGRELIRGHDRSLILSASVTVAGSVTLIALGVAVAIAVDVMLQSLGQPDHAPIAYFRAQNLVPVVGSALILGLLVGLAERRTRLARFSILHKNEQFLLKHNIRATGGKDVTHLDTEDIPLRMLETTRDSIVLMLVGQRGKRAFIHLAPDGSMVTYSRAAQ